MISKLSKNLPKKSFSFKRPIRKKYALPGFSKSTQCGGARLFFVLLVSKCFFLELGKITIKELQTVQWTENIDSMIV